MRNLHTDIAKINKDFNKKIAKIEKARARAIAKAVIATERAAVRLQMRASRMLDAVREVTNSDPRIEDAVREAHATRAARSRREHEKLMAARAAKRAARAAERTAARDAVRRAATDPTVDATIAQAIKELFDLDIE